MDSNINTVIDIGANIGEFTFIFSELFPNAYIYAFEPLPDCFNQLEKRTKNMRNIKIFNFALGSTEGELKLHKSSWHPASSFREMGDLHKQNYPHSSESDDLIVRIKKLDDIFKKESLTNNIFIKMDVQGFEDEVIKGGPNIFKNAKVVVVESSYQKLYDNEPLFDGIYSLLKPLGFEFRGSLKQSVSKSDESFLQADCIFIKRNNNV
ncbi:MAG: FkbM family methyltransferase [Mariniphaga sp.]|nr:FkbM family methyltransferase [Mariniphaga sp.]